MSDPITAYRVADANPATTRQTLPGESRHVPIVWLVTHDLEKRAAAGEQKYGEKLRGFNGRQPLIDAYQESLDLAMYLRQEIYERERVEQELTRLRIENEALRQALAIQPDDLK